MSKSLPPSVITLLRAATPECVRFIKLGRKSVWWPVSKESNTVRIGFKEFDFQLCAKQDWKAARQEYSKTTTRARPSDVTRAVNQVKDFFELPESTLWFTIENGDVWWCFASANVENIYTGNDEEEEKKGARLRRVIDKWRNTDLAGARLRLDTLTTKITKVASFQETICKPHGAVDLLRRIRCQQSPAHTLASKSLKELVRNVGDLLDQLHQDDFELLIELVFSSSGWQRISAVGGIQKTLDMALRLPTTGESCFVQVKSQTNLATFNGLVEELDNYSGYAGISGAKGRDQRSGLDRLMKAVARREFDLVSSWSVDDDTILIDAVTTGVRKAKMIERYTDHAANERTFLAWVRTSIAIMAFGFLVEKFDLFLEFASKSLATRLPSIGGQLVGNIAGLLLIALGGATMVLAIIRFRHTSLDIDSADTRPGTGDRMDIMLTILLVILGAALFVYLSYTLISRI